MKELILSYSKYHLWANRLLLDTIQAVPPAKHQQAVPSSFGSLYNTILHMWTAESIWWQRLKLEERIVPPAPQTQHIPELADGLLQQNGLWCEWIGAAPERKLHHEFIYYNSKKEKFKQPVYQMLLHLFNHGTYHRGQLVIMLRQLEVTQLPATDYIEWSRKVAK